MPTKYVIKIKNGLEEYQLKDAEARASYESLATVAKTGSYNDLSNKPTIGISDDAAQANWGGEWRMPTRAEFQALSAATTNAWVTNYNGSEISGRLFTDKIDSSKVLFFPAAGYCNDGSVNDVGNEGNYWSSSFLTGDPQYAFNLYFNYEDAHWDDNNNRYNGFAVRGILDGSNANANGHDYVEIGGVKWATMNIGATGVTDAGLYFQWGDSQGYTADQVGSESGQKYFGWADYKYGDGTSSPGSTGMTKYNATDGLTVLETSEPISSLHKVAVSGSYNDLNDKPTTLSGYGIEDAYTKEDTDTLLNNSLSIIDDAVSAALVNLDKRLRLLLSNTAANAVDMGLPSGRLWADCNVGAESETGVGLFFQWGDVEGFSKDSGRYCSGTRNGERDWSGDYARTHGSELGDSQNIPTDPYFDAARKYMGSPWRMPTTEEFQELFNSLYTTNAWVTNYKGSGMNGRLVTSKANGNTLFFPAAGYFIGGFDGFGSDGSYWSSSVSGEENACCLGFTSGGVYPDNGTYRYCGYSVRAVQ